MENREVKLYVVHKLVKRFEPTYEIDSDYKIETNEEDALNVYNGWKKEEKETTEYNKIGEIEETEFPFKDGYASYEVSDGTNSVIISITPEDIKIK